MADLIGQRLGQYDIIALLGKGGMATVYRATQSTIRREVAVKVIKAELTTSSDFTKRFEREAQTIASLSHPHILKVFDYGQYGDVIYLVMELFRGGSLSDMIRQSRLSVQAASHVLDQVAGALDYAHARGIVHRDLKPQNILLDEQKNAFLTDFGIAKLLQEGPGLTQTGIALGTPSYMAPEQWRGEPVDARSDIYALGIVLYEMLTGRIPFEGDTPFAVMHKHVYEGPPSVRELLPELPNSVDEVVRKALAKERHQRYASATEMATAFRNAIVGVPAMPRPVRNVPPSDATIAETAAPSTVIGRPSSRRGFIIGAGAAVIVLLGALALWTAAGGGLAALFPRTAIPTGQATSAPTVAVVVPTAAATIAPTVVPSAAAAIATTSVPTAAPTIPPTTAVSATTLPPTTVPTQAPTAAVQIATEVPNFTVTATVTATSTLTASPTASATDTPAPTTAPSNTPSVAPTATLAPSPVIVALPTSTVATLAPTAVVVANTPTGVGQILFVSDRGGNPDVYLMDSTGANQQALTRHLKGDSLGAWSPDGNTIAFETSRDLNQEIYLMDADGKNQRRLTNNKAADWLPTWSPDGQHIAFTSDRDGNREIYVMDADGKNLRRLTNSRGADWLPAWSPDGLTIAFTSDRDGSMGIYLMDADGQNQRRITSRGSSDFSPAWSPDSRFIAFVSERDGNREIYGMNANGSNVRRLTNSPATDFFPAWSPDGTQIAFTSERDGNQEIYVMDMDGSNVRRLTNNPAADFGPAWRPR